MTSYVIVMHVTKHEGGMEYIIVTVTQLYDIKKNVEGFKTDNII